jgi:tetratricopeptide (TPR) repeat protein
MKGNATRRRSYTCISRFVSFLLLILHCAALPFSAQDNPHQRLITAAELCLQGHFEAAIDLARPILDSTTLSQTERGRGWTLLGSAYQNQGEFQEAMTAYETALQILESGNENVPDYASTLTTFGTLFRDMKQFDAAVQMELRALQLDQKSNNHEGVATVCAVLADLELGLRHTRKARAWLDKAADESKLAPGLSEDFYASVTSSHAWLEELKGHIQAAIAGYEKEIDYLTHSHGEENPQVGWAYMLLGKAYLRNGDVSDALNSMSKGLALMLQTLGTRNLRYLVAQVEYAQALKSAGMKAEAARTKLEAESEIRSLFEEQCSQCRITAVALH